MSNNQTVKEAPDALSATFSALADSTRRAILSRLSGRATVNEVAAASTAGGADESSV